MRAIGIVVLLLGLGLLGRTLFALAWDAGTSRVWDDWIFVAFAVLLLLGGTGMTFEQAWGWKVAAVTVVLAAAFVALAVFTSTRNAHKALQLHELPEGRGAVGEIEKRIASELGHEWWSTPVDRLVELRRDKNPAARAWEIQGDDRVRLIVLRDPSLPVLPGERIPLNAFLIAPADSGRVARAALEGFYTAERNLPIELQLRDDGDDLIAIVAAKSAEGCVTKTFRLDRAGITQIKESAGACR